MVKAYNIAATHRLTPIAGFDEITHLQKVAPMDSTAASYVNEAGEEPGMHAGSVMSLDSTGKLVAGAKGTAMPLFLLWNSYDSDAQPLSATTANGMNMAGIQGIGGLGNTIDSAALIRYLYSDVKVSGGEQTTSNMNIGGNITNTSGGANSLRANSGSYSLTQPVGSYTTWPATCGLELSSTEFDFAAAFEGNTRNLNTSHPFVINALLTSPAATGTLDTSITNVRAQYQKRRGGYLTVLTDTYKTAIQNKAKEGKTAGTAYEGYYNVCGTVSRSPELNENGVYVLYFWAERTLIPFSGTVPQTTENTQTPG